MKKVTGFKGGQMVLGFGYRNNKKQKNMTRLLIALNFIFLLFACQNQIIENQSNETDSENDFSSVDIFETNQWNDFRYGVITGFYESNGEEFDMLKHYNPDQVSESLAMEFFEDPYTKSVLENTNYEDLEDAIFDGVSSKAFYVVVASSDIMIGTIYYFSFGTYGVQLIGSMPY